MNSLPASRLERESSKLYELKSKGYINSKIQLPLEYLKKVEEHYRKTIAGVDNKKLSKLAKEHEPNNEIGFWIRNRDLGDDDDKTWFHYHRAFPKFLNEKARIFNKEELDYLETLSMLSGEIYDEVQRTFTKEIYQLDKEVPGIRDKLLNYNDGKIYLRFLNYTPKKGVLSLATPHFDRGALTLTIYESHPGLRISPDESLENFVDVDYEEFDAKLFTGNKFELVMPDRHPMQNFRTNHEVVMPKGIGLETRTAIVAFLHPLDTPIGYNRNTDVFSSKEEKHNYVPKGI